ncbi:MAG: DNA repair protein RecO [Coriobacteriia bacterium]|nr:DNA repair protein RecO [Coriobacteriia bacterium]
MQNKVRGIVLKKTKLAETDLIITLLCEDGSQLRAVAKSARKPSSSFASRLELFCLVEMLIAHGRNLAIVREVKLIEPYTNIRGDVDKVSAVSPALELLARTTRQDLPLPALYSLTVSFLKEVNKIGDVLYDYLKVLCCAHLLKTCSYLGYRPNFTSCVLCGRERSLSSVDLPTPFSYTDGGLVCSHCANTEMSTVSQQALLLSHQLIHTKFSEIALISTNTEAINQTLAFCKNWIIYHLDIKLRSLDLYL